MNNVDRILRELGLPPEDVPYDKAMKAHKSAKASNPKGVCGKTCFPSECSARNGARALLRKGRANTSFLRVYLCRKCSAWHISSQKHDRK